MINLLLTRLAALNWAPAPVLMVQSIKIGKIRMRVASF